MAAFLNFSPSGRDKSEGAGGENSFFRSLLEEPGLDEKLEALIGSVEGWTKVLQRATTKTLLACCASRATARRSLRFGTMRLTIEVPVAQRA